MTDLSRHKMIYITIMYIYNNIINTYSNVHIDNACEIDIEQTRDGWKEGLIITVTLDI